MQETVLEPLWKWVCHGCCLLIADGGVGRVLEYNIKQGVPLWCICRDCQGKPAAAELWGRVVWAVLLTHPSPLLQ